MSTVYNYTLFWTEVRSKTSEYKITLWFLCLEGLIQTRGKVARVKSVRNMSRRRVILRFFVTQAQAI